MTDGQIKAMFTMLEYIAKQINTIKTENAQQVRRLRESNAALRAEVKRLTKENKELHAFKFEPL